MQGKTDEKLNTNDQSQSRYTTSLKKVNFCFISPGS